MFEAAQFQLQKTTPLSRQHLNRSLIKTPAAKRAEISKKKKTARRNFPTPKTHFNTAATR